MLTAMYTNKSDSMQGHQARKTKEKKIFASGKGDEIHWSPLRHNRFQKRPPDFILVSLKAEFSTSKRSDSFFPYLNTRSVRKKRL